MNRAMYDRELFAYVLHDVDLTTSWPMDSVNIAAQQPEGRPDSLTIGKFDTRSEASIGRRKFILLSGALRCNHAISGQTP